MTETVELTEALDRLGFLAEKEDRRELRWGDALLTACFTPIGWHLLVTRQATPDCIWAPRDLLLPSEARWIDMLLVFTEALKDLGIEPLPEPLQTACDLRRREREARAEIASRTTIQADASFLRFCITRLRVLATAQVTPVGAQEPPRADLALSHAEGQLCLQALGVVMCCPASGRWDDIVVVDLREFLSRVRRRFRGSAVSLQYDERNLLIDGRAIPRAPRATKIGK